MCMRTSGASELRKFRYFYILKLLFFKYFVGTSDTLSVQMTCLSAYMYRQKVPPPPLATLMPCTRLTVSYQDRRLRREQTGWWWAQCWWGQRSYRRPLTVGRWACGCPPSPVAPPYHRSLSQCPRSRWHNPRRNCPVQTEGPNERERLNRSAGRGQHSLVVLVLCVTKVYEFISLNILKISTWISEHHHREKERDSVFILERVYSLSSGWPTRHFAKHDYILMNMMKWRHTRTKGVFRVFNHPPPPPPPPPLSEKRVFQTSPSGSERKNVLFLSVCQRGWWCTRIPLPRVWKWTIKFWRRKNCWIPPSPPPPLPLSDLFQGWRGITAWMQS